MQLKRQENKSEGSAKRAPEQKPGTRTLADSRLRVKRAARLQCLEDDPLEFWDYGMLYAFDVIEAQLLDELSGGKVLTVEAVQEVVAKEREIVFSADLHSFYLMAKPRPKSTEGPLPRVVKKIAAARSR